MKLQQHILMMVVEAPAANHVTFEYMNVIYTRAGEHIGRMTRYILVLTISSNTE